ncbi:unnamed protein product [Calypogeia fissa]
MSSASVPLISTRSFNAPIVDVNALVIVQSQQILKYSRAIRVFCWETIVRCSDWKFGSVSASSTRDSSKRLPLILTLHSNQSMDPVMVV